MRRVLAAFLFIQLVYSDTYCPRYWFQVQRESGPWCMRAYYHANTSLELAKSICKCRGAVMSSFENMEEIKASLIHAMSWLPVKKTFSSVIDRLLLVGGLRKEICDMDTNQIDPSCYPLNKNAFYWTDGVANSKVDFSWAPNQPDNYLGNQRCVGVYTYGSRAGLLDDATITNLPYNQGVICGKRPNRRY